MCMRQGGSGAAPHSRASRSLYSNCAPPCRPRRASELSARALSAREQRTPGKGRSGGGRCVCRRTQQRRRGRGVGLGGAAAPAQDEAGMGRRGRGGDGQAWEGRGPTMRWKYLSGSPAARWPVSKAAASRAISSWRHRHVSTTYSTAIVLGCQLLGYHLRGQRRRARPRHREVPRLELKHRERDNLRSNIGNGMICARRPGWEVGASSAGRGSSSGAGARGSSVPRTREETAPRRRAGGARSGQGRRRDLCRQADKGDRGRRGRQQLQEQRSHLDTRAPERSGLARRGTAAAARAAAAVGSAEAYGQREETGL